MRNALPQGSVNQSVKVLNGLKSYILLGDEGFRDVGLEDS